MTGMRNWRTEQSWSEFSEIEPGLWLPRRGRINRLAELNPSFETWSIESVDLNPRLSDADFRIPVVEGTSISQARDPSGKLPDGAPLPMPVAVEDDTDQWKWNLGLAVACLLAIVGLMGWWRRA